MIDEYIYQLENFTSIGPKVVVEIGALDGVYSGILKKKFRIPNENIYFVEPNPELQINLQRKFPKATIIREAISNEKSTAQMNKVRSSNRSKIGSSSLLQRIDGWNESLVYDQITVNTITGKMLLDRICQPIDACIIDVEGLAYDAIASFEDKLTVIKSLMVECEHAEIFKGQRLFDDVSRLLIQNGYRLMAFKYAYPNQSDSIWVHEKYVDLAFKEDSQPIKKVSWSDKIKGIFS